MLLDENSGRSRYPARSDQDGASGQGARRQRDHPSRSLRDWPAPRHAGRNTEFLRACARSRSGADAAGTGSGLPRGVRRVLAAEKPDWVLVHGDTTTAMAATLAGFYAGCSIGNVEAGLRTGDLRQPWPEEMNRSVIDRIADRLFAPTASARDNLLRENVSAAKIAVTGNTVIDALFAVRDTLERDAGLTRALGQRFGFLDPAKRLVLVTGHRRESFGRGFEGICAGLRRIAERADVEIVYPVHLNPAVQRPVRRALT